MAKLTPEEFQEKHARRLKEALTDMQAGVEKVTESPMAKAALKKDKMRAGINKAIDSGKWEAGLKRVSLEDWKAKMVNKGLPRVAEGIDNAADKVIAFAGELNTFQDSLKKTVDALPDVTLENSIARMTTWVRGMAKFQRKA